MTNGQRACALIHSGGSVYHDSSRVSATANLRAVYAADTPGVQYRSDYESGEDEVHFYLYDSYTTDRNRPGTFSSFCRDGYEVTDVFNPA